MPPPMEMTVDHATLRAVDKRPANCPEMPHLVSRTQGDTNSDSAGTAINEGRVLSPGCPNEPSEHGADSHSEASSESTMSRYDVATSLA